MSDFFDSAKNFVNSAVSRTGWEAQKQLRVRSKQSEIDKLIEQRAQLSEELCQIAMNLYQQGALSDTQLSRLCASIFELDHDMRSREQQLQEAKNEAYPADQFAPNQPMNYAPPAPNAPTANPHGTDPSGYANPNPNASQNPNQNANPNPNAAYGASAGAAPAPGQVLCPQCHSVVRANSLYCRNCGAKVR